MAGLGGLVVSALDLQDRGFESRSDRENGYKKKKKKKNNNNR